MIVYKTFSDTHLVKTGTRGLANSALPLASFWARQLGPCFHEALALVAA